jgi:hypothetical protein
MLFALAAHSFAQDPNANRMNNPYPEPGTREAIDHAPTRRATPSPFANRMNVEYGERTSVETAGAPDPYANRMNAPVPKPVPNPDQAPEQYPVR